MVDSLENQCQAHKVGLPVCRPPLSRHKARLLGGLLHTCGDTGVVCIKRYPARPGKHIGGLVGMTLSLAGSSTLRSGTLGEAPHESYFLLPRAMGGPSRS